jgi:hypothetical protein
MAFFWPGAGEVGILAPVFTSPILVRAPFAPSAFCVDTAGNRARGPGTK